MSRNRNKPKPGAYRPFVAAPRPGGRPDRAPVWRVLVHRQYEGLWQELPERISLEKAQLFWDHVAHRPDRPPRIGTSSVMRGRHKGGGGGWSPTIHYEISGAGRIDYQHNAAYRTRPDGDAHPVVRILVIDLRSH